MHSIAGKTLGFGQQRNQTVILKNPLHDERVTVWAAFNADGIVGPFFFEDDEGNADTVNKDRYLSILKKRFIPALRIKGFNINDVWFQQDRATPHIARDVLVWLSKTFGQKSISFRTDQEWPPHSPDLSPLDFFLWVNLKNG